MSQNNSTPALQEIIRSGFEFYRIGQFQAALDLVKHKTLSNAEPTILLLHALCLSALGKAKLAHPLFEQLTRDEPLVSEHWCNLGNVLCELDRELDARQPLLRSKNLGNTSVGLYFALARMHAASGELDEAFENITRAIQLVPQDIEFHLLRARILFGLDRWQEAQSAVRTLDTALLNIEQKIDCGYQLAQVGLYYESKNIFLRVLQQDDNNIDAMLGLATTLERSNEIEQAISLQLKIASNLSHQTNTKLKQKLLQLDARLAARKGRESDVQTAIYQLLSEPIPDCATKIGLLYELAQSMDRSSDTKSATNYLTEAHALRAERVTRNHPSMANSDSLMQVMQRRVPDYPISENLNDGHLDPVFLVGFPRSGTTLLEQLLDAHANLASFDEQPFLQKLITQIDRTEPGYPDALSVLMGSRISELRARYFNMVHRALPNLGTRRAVDKNPLNFARLPLVDALFPDAKILLAIRHPCDVVLSCYFQNFRAPALAITFKTLLSTAQMYDQVFRYWDQWRIRIRVPTHVLRYEDLVGNFAFEAKLLFEFLKEPWTDELLQFTERAKSRGAISTPSYTEVVKPVNSRAVGKWRRYEDEFTPEVMRYLQPWIERFGYVE